MNLNLVMNFISNVQLSGARNWIVVAEKGNTNKIGYYNVDVAPEESQ